MKQKQKHQLVVKILIILVLALLMALVITKNSASKHAEPVKNAEENNTLNNSPYTMQITSRAFSHLKLIPPLYTCDGQNISPPLTIEEVPEEAKSLVLIVDDPDAPGRTFVHWTLWNISPSTSEIHENAVPQNAIQGRTDFGANRWGGPCPPSKTHRYFFKLYALDAFLDLHTSSSKSDIEQAMNGHIIATAELIGLYTRR